MYLMFVGCLLNYTSVCNVNEVLLQYWKLSILHESLHTWSWQ